MYKAFIVDDEPSVIEGMKIMIPWNEYGFDLCGEASNAQEALLEIEQLRPHLLITDIRMPQKSGLTLINDVRKLDIVMEYVILSGYSEFSYAREAMRNDVSYYLLKPVDKDEITSVLQSIKKKLDAAFLKEYGFTQEEVETLRLTGFRSPDTGGETPAGEDPSPWWKAVRDDFDEEITQAMKLMSYQDAEKLIEELFNFIMKREISLAEASIMVNSCIYHILSIAFERNIRISHILPAEKTERLSFHELKERIKEILSKAISQMLEDRRRNSRSYLYKVKAYIENNYNKEVSVSSLAEMEFMEAGYLGEAFIKQFGCSINEYQHRIRIGKAIELINNSDMKLNDISAAVGYKNYNNFFTHFERITHKKPNQYIAEISQKDPKLSPS